MILLTSTSAVVFIVAYHSLLEGTRVRMRLYTLHCSYAVYLPTPFTSIPWFLQIRENLKCCCLRLSVLARKVRISPNIGFYIS